MKSDFYKAYNEIGNEFRSRDDIGVLSVVIGRISDTALNKSIITDSLIANCDEISAIRVGNGIKVFLSDGRLLSEVVNIPGNVEKIWKRFYRLDKRMIFNNIHVNKVDLSKLELKRFYGREAFSYSHIDDTIVMPEFSNCASVDIESLFSGGTVGNVEIKNIHGDITSLNMNSIFYECTVNTIQVSNIEVSDGEITALFGRCYADDISINNCKIGKSEPVHADSEFRECNIGNLKITDCELSMRGDDLFKDSKVNRIEINRCNIDVECNQNWRAKEVNELVITDSKLRTSSIVDMLYRLNVKSVKSNMDVVGEACERYNKMNSVSGLKFQTI